MFPKEIWFNPIWCLYDTTTGTTVLKHPYPSNAVVPCPQCGENLRVVNYKAECCGYHFRVSFNEISQREPIGKHDKRSGCGWQSLRPYKKQE